MNAKFVSDYCDTERMTVVLSNKNRDLNMLLLV